MKGSGGGSFEADKEKTYLYVRSGGQLKRVSLSSGETKQIAFEAFQDYRPYAERDYIFHHAWSQVKDKFYDVDLHGVDWTGYPASRERLLRRVHNHCGGAGLLAGMVGELKASHPGAR